MMKDQDKVKNNYYPQHYDKRTQCTFNANNPVECQLTGQPLIYCRTDLSICNGLAHHFAHIICHWQQTVFFVTPVSFFQIYFPC